MSDEPKKTVKVRALQAHTTSGNAYEVGDLYDLDEALVDTVILQGKAERVVDSESADLNRKDLRTES